MVVGIGLGGDFLIFLVKFIFCFFGVGMGLFIFLVWFLVGKLGDVGGLWNVCYFFGDVLELCELVCEFFGEVVINLDYIVLVLLEFFVLFVGVLDLVVRGFFVLLYIVVVFFGIFLFF